MRFLFLLLAGVGAVVRVTPNHIEAECDRDYELKENVICNTTMYDRWTATSDAQGTFAEMTLENGVAFANKRCEEACARTNACRAYGVRSDPYVCLVYFDCPATQPSDVTLFVRKPPFDCFIKATSFDGVLQNYAETTQFARLVRVPVQPFQEVHVSINGIVNTTAFAYRPYKNLGPQYCNVTENTLNCVLLNAGEISVVFFFTFVVLLSWNTFLVLGLVSKYLD